MSDDSSECYNSCRGIFLFWKLSFQFWIYYCYRYFVNMLKVLNWPCGLICGSVWGLWVVLNSAASVTDIDIISPLQTPHSRASNEGSRRLCKDFTITKKALTPLGQVAPTMSLVGAFSVIVKSLHNIREPSFEALLCGVWSGQMISISVTEAAELSTTHRPHTLPQTRPQCQFNTFNMLMLTKYL